MTGKGFLFLFFVYNVVKILLSILSVTEYHSRVKYIISLDITAGLLPRISGGMAEIRGMRPGAVPRMCWLSQVSSRYGGRVGAAIIGRNGQDSRYGERIEPRLSGGMATARGMAAGKCTRRLGYMAAIRG